MITSNGQIKEQLGELYMDEAILDKFPSDEYIEGARDVAKMVLRYIAPFIEGEDSWMGLPDLEELEGKMRDINYAAEVKGQLRLEQMFGLNELRPSIKYRKYPKIVCAEEKTATIARV